MSLVPGPPTFSPSLPGYTPKSFWQRPEGPFGIVALIALIAAGGIGLYVILPFLITLLTNTLYAAALAAVLFAIGWLALNPTFRAAVRNLFQNIVRWFASFVVETDPIGILRNNLDDMKKEKNNLDQTVQRFSGSEEKLQRSISGRMMRSTRWAERRRRQRRLRAAHETRWNASACCWKSKLCWRRPGC